ncbi:predicted protein, partial [Nematostella vectensis]
NGCSSNPCSASVPCHPGDLPSMHRCVCPPGFTGIQCDDIDECTNASACHVNAACTNTPGSYTCTCKQGYHGDGKRCD